MSSSAPTENEIIAQRAYQLWEAIGYEHGHDQDHWRQAEHELKEHQLKEELASKRGQAVEPPAHGAQHLSAKPAVTPAFVQRPVPAETLHHARHV